MHIHELITETKIDELSLSGIGRGIGRGVGATAHGLGAVAGGAHGAWEKMKQGYQAGKSYVSGQQPRRSTPSANQPSTGANAPQQSATGAQPSATGAQSASASPAPQQTAAPAAMKAAEIVKDLDDVWQKATADQGSETTSHQVQSQIKTMAKQAGLTGQTISERKAGFNSKFLGMTI